jgi:hypothetical protein
MVDGWPIAHHVFAGNRRDANTVADVLRDLEQRFGLKRVVFVGDRGMVTSQNLDDLRGGGHGYIVGRNRRRSGEVFDYIQNFWLGREGSNLRMVESKSTALPLGDAPTDCPESAGRSPRALSVATSVYRES